MPVIDGRQLQQQADAKAVVLPADWTIEPVEDFLLVDRAPLSGVSAGGVLLPDSVGSRYEGTVLAHGPRVTQYAAGDQILFLPHAGIPIRHGERLLILFRQDAVFSKVHVAETKSAERKPARRRR